MAKRGFVYDELSSQEGQHEIRLVRLLPGRQSWPIRCEIITSMLSEGPSYEALSYVWGDPTDRKHISLQGSAFEVTRNLFDALHVLRTSSDARLLWIDAICINQKSIPEKNHQIRLMRLIYETADRVSIFLGNPSPAFDINWLSLVPQFLQALYVAEQKQIKLRTQSVDDLEHGSENRDDRNISRLLRNLDAVGLPSHLPFPRVYEAFGEILSRPWFKRIWILQEIAVSQSAVLIYGDRSVPWDDFYKALLACKSFGLIPIFIDPLVCQWAQFIGGLVKSVRRRRPLTLLQLLVNFRNCEATDPRDKFFALCGLIAEGTPNIVPDYASNVLYVYRYVASEILQEPKGLDLFQVPRSRQSPAKWLLPSWCYDWSCDFVDGDVLFEPHQADPGLSKYNFKASRKVRSYLKFDEQLRTLTLKGAYYDEITAAAEMMGESILARSHVLTLEPDLVMPLTDRELLLRTQQQIDQKYHANIEERKVLKNWKRLAYNMSRYPYPTGENHEDVYRKTLTADFAPGGEDAQKKAFRKWVRYQKLTSLLPMGPKSRENRILQAGNMMAISRFRTDFPLNMIPIIGRRLARTKRGYLALVPNIACRGDEIWLVQVSSVPLIL